MFKILFISFLTVPLIEIYFLIQVGSVIGPLPTIALCLFTAALGAFLIREQGIQTLQRVQNKINRGEMPASDVIEGFILLISGLLLLTPGLVTDLIGFLCTIPRLRTWVAISFLGKLVKQSRNNPRDNMTIIEGEYWEDENKKLR